MREKGIADAIPDRVPGRAFRASLRVGQFALFCLTSVYLFEVWRGALLEAPAPTALVYDRDGTFVTQIGHEHSGRIDYGYWRVDPLPERVARATLALEDRRFRRHIGVDPLAIGRALWRNLSGERRSGASTIAMQVARMQRPASRTYWSKAVEAGRAVALTLRYGREAVLAHYLRLVPYGNGSHGIGHAARWYFGKPVGDLSWAEIALLSAVPQSPTVMNLQRPTGLQRARLRGQRALDRLAGQGVISATEHDLAVAQLGTMLIPAPPRRPDALHAVLRLEEMIRRHPPPRDPTDPRIRTTLDLGLQREVLTMMRRHLSALHPAGAEQAAVMVVQRKGRKVLAAIGSGDYEAPKAGAIDFTRTDRSPGSTLKPFIYALALDRDRLLTSDVMADLPEGASGIGNADGRFLGPLLPRQALANSRNVPATGLVRDLGLTTTFRFFRDLGLHEIDAPAEAFGLSMAIGTLPTTLDRLMHAYGTIAEDGISADLVWHEGQAQRQPVRLISIDTARLMTLFLSDPLARLPSFPRYGPTEYPFPVALKTGTSQGYRDAWIVAWSQSAMVGVWLGRPDAGTTYKLTGGNAAAKLAREILLHLHGSRPGDLADARFPEPPGLVPVELCVYGGKRSAGGCGQTLTEWVRPDAIPPLEVAATIKDERLTVAMPSGHRSWAMANKYPLEERPVMPGDTVRLSIVTPEQNSRIWRNPETPPALNRLALKVVSDPPVEQVVWYVDDEPFAVTDPDKPVLWPMTPGAHRFEVRLPLREGASPPVRVVIE